MKHLIFDLHNTLVFKKYSYYQLFEQIVDSYGVKNLFENLPDADFDKVIYQNIFSFPPEHFNNINSKENWLSVFNKAIVNINPPKMLNIELLSSEIYFRLCEASNWEIYDDVIDTINYLRKNKVSFGFLSNWDTRMRILWEGLSQKLNSQGELSLFSYQVGFCKPNPMFFKTYIDLATQRYGNIDNFFKLGDDISTDNGGIGLGVNFCHINRHKQNFNLLSEVKSIIEL